MLQEHTMSIDEFNNPKIMKSTEAIATTLIRLLLLEPNTFETHPEMGVGLVSNYRYSFLGRADELKSHFQEQIDKYLPTFQGIQIDVQEYDGTYHIYAEINGTLYGISVDNTFDVQFTYKTLTEIKS